MAKASKGGRGGEKMTTFLSGNCTVSQKMRTFDPLILDGDNEGLNVATPDYNALSPFLSHRKRNDFPKTQPPPIPLRSECHAQ